MEGSLHKDLAKEIVDEFLRRIRQSLRRAWRQVAGVLVFLGTLASISSLILWWLSRSP